MQGPRLKKIRRLGTPLPGLTRKQPKDGANPPGQHGAAFRRKKSNYAQMLEEKQKVRYHYGISERQMRNAFARAAKLEGATGENLLAMLELRLDSVVFRLGFAPTIPAARQLVSHGHVRVNGRRVDRASFHVPVGAEVSLNERARSIPDVLASVENGPEVRLPEHLALDPADKFTGRVVGQPARNAVPFIVNETAIVEFYAR